MASQLLNISEGESALQPTCCAFSFSLKSFSKTRSWMKNEYSVWRKTISIQEIECGTYSHDNSFILHNKKAILSRRPMWMYVNRFGSMCHISPLFMYNCMGEFRKKICHRTVFAYTTENQLTYFFTQDFQSVSNECNHILQ